MTQPMMLLSRGLRNNNPGNIRSNINLRWHGQTGCDEQGFCVFKDAYSGLRALRVLLVNYHALHNCVTIRDYIQRYAPHNENDTEAYIEAVCKHFQNSSDTELSMPEALPELMKAIIVQENGSCPYTAKEINETQVYHPVMV